MNDISGRGTKRTTQDEALFPDLKEQHENHPKPAHEDADESKKKKGHPRALWQRWKAGTIHNQLTVIFTVLIFLATSAYAIFSGYQLSVMKQQVAEMKSGSADTHTLAVAADTQSKQAIEQTNTMGKSLKKTDDLIRATSDLARESKRSADIAQNSMNASLAVSHLDERPWVGMINMLVSPIAVDKKIIGTIQIRNTGKTVALNVKMQAWIHLSPSPMTELEHPDVEGRGSAVVIFPNQEMSLSPAITRLTSEAEVKALKE